jgi:uncharacterized membrane protein YidH (DUF202 family)
MSSELVTQGIAAFKAGDRAKARQLLISAIRQNPNNEEALSWLYFTLENKEQKTHCLEEVLRINPANEKARKTLEHLRAPAQPMDINQPIIQAPIELPTIQPYQPQANPTPVNRSRQNAPNESINVGSILIIVSGALIILGAILPWASVISVFGRISVYGYEGDGMLTGIIGILLMILGFFRIKTSSVLIGALAIILGILAGIIGGLKFFNLIINLMSTEYVKTSIGIGLYITILGGIGGFIGGVAKI